VVLLDVIMENVTQENVSVNLDTTRPRTVNTRKLIAIIMVLQLRGYVCVMSDTQVLPVSLRYVRICARDMESVWLRENVTV